jgi:hypothetical protein
VTRFALFLSSYVPLFLMLALRFTEAWLVAGCIVLAIVGAGLGVWILYPSRDRSGGTITVETVSDAGDQATTYLVSYLLPFFAVEQPTIREVAAYAVFLLVVGLVYTRSDMRQVNPFLYLLGRRVTKVVTSEKREVYAVSRRRVLRGDLQGAEITSGLFLVADGSWGTDG